MKTLKKWSVIVMIMLATVIGSSSCEEQLVEPNSSIEKNDLKGSFDGNDDEDPDLPCSGCITAD